MQKTFTLYRATAPTHAASCRRHTLPLLVCVCACGTIRHRASDLLFSFDFSLGLFSIFYLSPPGCDVFWPRWGLVILFLIYTRPPPIAEPPGLRPRPCRGSKPQTAHPRFRPRSRRKALPNSSGKDAGERSSQRHRAPVWGS